MLDRDGVVREEKTYSGEDAAENFVMTVMLIAQRWLPSMSPGQEMEELSEEVLQMIDETTHCYLCRLPLEDDRVHDHDHLNRK